MKFLDIEQNLKNFIGIRFAELFTKEELKEIHINKGKSGLLLEKICKLSPSSRLLDLEDIEIKTQSKNESIAITSISSHVNDLINHISFEESWLFKKIKRVLFVKIDKRCNFQDWRYLFYKIIDLDENKELFYFLKKEYDNICRQILLIVNNGEMLRTINGNIENSYLQIRTKDSKPYHPIIYKGKAISDKNYAFYFRNVFMREIIETNI